MPGDQFQYVKLPDGSYGKFLANASDDQIRSQIQKDYPSAFSSDPNLVTGQGMMQQATNQARADYMRPLANAVPETQQPMTAGAVDASILSAMQKQYPNATSPKTIATVYGSLIAPGLAPEAASIGAPLVERALPWLARAGLTAAGAGGGTMAGQALSGQNPITLQSLKESGQNAAIAGGSDLVLGALPWLAGSKISRGMINSSVGATARDVTYGNPAKALLNEGINSPFTGDIEAYKAALRSGASPDQALVSAGGRMGAVSARINQLAPRLNTALSSSSASIPIADVVDKPLQDAATEIITNRAMTQAEKDAAIGQLGALQQSLKEGLGQNLTPLQANELKQQIGARVNWGGTISVTDEVKPAYRAVYGSLKNAVNQAVPGSATLNERLTDLLAAQGDLKKLMGAEEVGYGRGAMGSAVTGIARRLEAVGGRGIPVSAAAGRGAQRVVPPFLAGFFRPTVYANGQQ